MKVLSKMLFESPFGHWALAQLERRANLSLVKSDWLGDQIAPISDEGADRGNGDIGATPNVVLNYSTTNGGEQSEADRTRGLLLALNWYPGYDTRPLEAAGLTETLAMMVKQLDRNDQVGLWLIADRLHGTAPGLDFWKKHTRAEVTQT